MPGLRSAGKLDWKSPKERLKALIILLVMVPVSAWMYWRECEYYYRQPWHISLETAAFIQSIKVDIDRQIGPMFIIDIGGSRHECGGAADTSWGSSYYNKRIAYDPKDPRRCRVADQLNQFTEFEREKFSFSALMLFLNIMATLIMALIHFSLSSDHDTGIHRYKKQLRWIIPALGAVVAVVALAAWMYRRVLFPFAGF